MHKENINAPRIELSPTDTLFADHKQYALCDEGVLLNV